MLYALVGQQDIALAVGVGGVAEDADDGQLHQREGSDDNRHHLWGGGCQLMTAILHTVPFLPSLVAVATM